MTYYLLRTPEVMWKLQMEVRTSFKSYELQVVRRNHLQVDFGSTVSRGSHRGGAQNLPALAAWAPTRGA